VRFLLSPNLTLEAPGQLSREEALLRLEPPDGRGPAGTGRKTGINGVLRFSSRGRFPRAWLSPENCELAFYNLWYPLFSPGLEPFEFRLSVTEAQISAAGHADSPRTYISTTTISPRPSWRRARGCCPYWRSGSARSTP